MKAYLVTPLLLAVLAAPGSAQQPFQTTRESSLNQMRGLDFPETPTSLEMNYTTTRHHRTGRETMIGGSSLQTQAATAEEMSRVLYKPTAISPATSMVTPLTPALGEAAPRFSRKMESPALRQPPTTLPSLTGAGLGMGAFQGLSSPALQALPPMLYGKPPTPKDWQKQLISPLKGL